MGVGNLKETGSRTQQPRDWDWYHEYAYLR